MLRTDLIDLVNRGGVWAFVGSGVSIDAGGPSWKELIQESVARIDRVNREKILNDPRFQEALSKNRFAPCFSRIEAIASRQVLEEVVSARLDRLRTPGRIIRLLADWPFAGYITTNYDGLLESALHDSGGPGWIAVGNSDDEARQISGDATGVIWHVHGAIHLPQGRSRLVITEKDYDALYLGESHVIQQLKGLLSQRRIVFFGFGFEDQEVVRLLKAVGHLCNPARPAFAFLSGLSGTEGESQRLDLLEQYNIDVVPYRLVSGSHEQLLHLLEFYSAFVLRRSLRFNEPDRPCPSYDPETTGLLLYNNLALRQLGKLGGDVVACLVKARILALLKYRGSMSVVALDSDLRDRVKLIQGTSMSEHSVAHVSPTVNKCILELARDGLVNVPPTLAPASVVSLSREGVTQVDSHAGAATRLAQQFSACLDDRARESFPDNLDARARVARAAESFLKECVQRRAIGVAMAWNSPRLEFQRYHIVGLLQSLPDFMRQLKDADEGRALVRLVENLLARPNEAETKYLGVSLQAQFGVNLLGYDPETVETRARELSSTLFLIDSSTVIPLLARGSIGYQAARLLLDRLSVAKAAVATTALLATEVAEHARWALGNLVLDEARLLEKAFAATTGRAGYRLNAFVEGFVQEVGRGRSLLDFGGYLDAVCGHPRGHTGSEEAFFTAIRNSGVPCLGIDEWEGFEETLWPERDELASQIAIRRKGGIPPTYKHERQVRAEAEALIVVRNLRRGKFKFDGKEMRGAYFVSHTRAIDEVAGPGLPITMRPEAVLQWLSTVTACPSDELGFLVNNLLWELSERGLMILDRARLQLVFSPFISSAREKLQEEIETHRALIALRFGEDGAKAFGEVSDLDLPIVAHSYYAQKATELEQRLEKEEKARQALEARSRLTDKERRELAGLKAKAQERRRKAEAKRRGAASRRGGKRRRK